VTGVTVSSAQGPVEVDSLGYWNGQAWELSRAPLGRSFSVSNPPPDSFVVSASNAIYSDEGTTYKFHDWDASRTLRVAKFPTTPVITSHFRPVFLEVKMKSVLAGNEQLLDGMIEFMDPWLVDTVDGQFGNIKVNRGMSAAVFHSFQGEFKPNTALQSGLRYNGVFQSRYPSPDPYYVVRAPMTQSFGGTTAYFSHWDSTGVQLVDLGLGPNTRAVYFLSANATVKAVYGYKISNGFNLVSMPQNAPEPEKSIVYPTAISNASSLVGNSGFNADPLAVGRGYWVRFSGNQGVIYDGSAIDSAVVSVGSGWNIIGGLTSPLPTSKIIRSNGISVHSKYWWHVPGGSYQQDTVLRPGRGYFVKTSGGNGSLTLKLSSSSYTQPDTSAEEPPSPPAVMDSPTLSCINCSVGNAHPSISWTSVSGSSIAYTLYRYQCQFGQGDCNAERTLVYSGTGTSFVDNAVTVFQKTGINLVPMSTYFYQVFATASSGQFTVSNMLNVNSNDLNMVENASHGNVADERLGSAPVATMLIGSYPNPFNPTTQIRYGLVAEAVVTLKVYNTFGQEVANLVDEAQSAGYHEVVFDGSGLASGLYFYRLQAGTYTDTKKMMLLK
jgi:hypothetical protein